MAQVAAEPWQQEAYFELRRRIFVEEQQLFAADDRDAIDDGAYPIVAMSTAAGMAEQVIGVVRIYECAAKSEEHASRCFYGGRLGVDRRYRRHGAVGEALIRQAVGTARALGCSLFLATVQQANVRYFERRHFAVVGSQWVCGQPHALMQAELSQFTPQPLPAGSWPLAEHAALEGSAVGESAFGGRAA